MSTILTNNLNLPEPLYNAVKNQDYTVAGDYSVSNLIDSPQVRILRRTNEVEEDVSDRLWALLGTALHQVLRMSNIRDHKRRAFLTVIAHLMDKAERVEKHDKVASMKIMNAGKYLKQVADEDFPDHESDHLYEQTLSAEIDGVTIYGTFDVYQKSLKKLSDYKLTTAYSYIFEESRKQMITEVNCFAWLLRENGIPVDSIDLTMLFRDWSKSKMVHNKDYPTNKILSVPVKVFTQDQMTKYLSARVKLHRDADNGAPLNCTGAERWATADKWKVYNKGNIKARAVLDSLKGAERWVEENKHKFTALYIEMFPGESKRCAEFCKVNKFCAQYQSSVNKTKEIEP